MALSLFCLEYNFQLFAAVAQNEMKASWLHGIAKGQPFLFVFILLTHKGSHCIDYHDFRSNYDIFHMWCQGLFRPSVPCTAPADTAQFQTLHQHTKPTSSKRLLIKSSRFIGSHQQADNTWIGVSHPSTNQANQHRLTSLITRTGISNLISFCAQGNPLSFFRIEHACAIYTSI